MREHPTDFTDLDLMKHLKSYSNGKKSWKKNRLSKREKEACEELYANLIQLVTKVFTPLINRVNAQEMQTFTMHDSQHAIKVAYLMWHILSEERKKRLTPPEIALTIICSYLHDLGMGLSKEEKKKRLESSSDLWDKIDLQRNYRESFDKLQELLSTDKLSVHDRESALFQIEQAKEALLCADNRERHATHTRYKEMLASFRELHKQDPLRVPNIQSCLSFDGDSFEHHLIEICVSHNEDATVLLNKDPLNALNSRFPTELPVGCANADTQLIAALLRLSDILDFDRERTPAILYHYLLPRYTNPSRNIAIKEWSKHLSISNWQIHDDGYLVFNGRCNSAVIHHAVLEFIRVISDEITATKCILKNENAINLQPNISCNIQSDGYSYHPYHFSIDESQIYRMLMGKELYKDPMIAIREILQNSVDACLLRDCLLQHYNPHQKATKEERIIIRYEKATDYKESKISIIDSGCGMDRWIIENFLLKVGKSYYNSPEFLRTRAELSKTNHDFGAVSEFGIGILSSFMLCDIMEIETAIWTDVRNDTHKRLLKIDGLGRLIEVTETINVGLNRFSGTRVTLFLKESEKPSWDRVKSYLEKVALDLPYSICLEYDDGTDLFRDILHPSGTELNIPAHLKSSAIHVPVNDETLGLEGEIVLFRHNEAKNAEAILAKEKLINAKEITTDYDFYPNTGELLRGGFLIGEVPGLPRYIFVPASTAKIRLNWKGTPEKKMLSTDLTRSKIIKQDLIGDKIVEIWTKWLIDNIAQVEATGMGTLDLIRPLNIDKLKFLECYSALTVYKLIRILWSSTSDGKFELIKKWEAGNLERCKIGVFQSNYHWQLIDIILPRIVALEMGPQASYYVMQPIKNWEKVLNECFDFVSNPILWNSFCNYSSEIKDLLYYTYPGSKHFNVIYEKALQNVFDSKELERLQSILTKLIDAKRNELRMSIPKMDILLLKKCLGFANQVTIGSIYGNYKLSELITGLE